MSLRPLLLRKLHGRRMRKATTEVSSAQNHSFLFVGDSRTLGLQEALKADSPDDQCRFVAAEGEGFDWFSQDGIQAMDTELKATPDSTVITLR